MTDSEFIQAIETSNLAASVKSALVERLRFLILLEQELPAVRAERVSESERADSICKMFAEFITRTGVGHSSDECTSAECTCWQAPFRKEAFQQ